MSRKSIYLAAVAGATVPYLFFASFISDSGLGVSAFTSALFVNGAAGGFSADLLISSFVFSLWSFEDSRRHAVAHWSLVPATNLLVGLSLAMPLFLYLRYDKAGPRLHCPRNHSGELGPTS